MRRLTSRPTATATTARRADDQRGSAAVVVLLCFTALFAIGAVVVDVAALVQEKRVLQNGADAAALAIAAQCGTGDCAEPDTTAFAYADANADDAVTTVDEICGSGIPGYSECATAPELPDGANYVAVTTTTETADGGTEVPFGFARFLGLDGMAVTAQSIAAWGGPSSLTSALPVTISECEYDAYTDTGTVLQAPPPYDSGYPETEAVIYLHDTTGASPCASSNGSGADLPGGFGWLETSDECNATSDIDNWFDDSTGRPPPQSCTATLMAAIVGTVVALPIFDQTNGLTGTNGVYHMSGYAAFYVTGYSIVGQYKVPSLATGSYPCSGQASCISGYFVNAAAPVTGTIGGPSMGVTVVALVA